MAPHEPLYAIGASISTPLGLGVIRSRRLSRHSPGTILYEIQLDNESCIRTWTEQELIAVPNVARLNTRRDGAVKRHYVTGESVSTEEGEGIIRNLIHDVPDRPYAIVQLIGTLKTVLVPTCELNPPLEAA